MSPPSQRHRDELNLKEAFEFARFTLKMLLLINGSAALSILTFYGNIGADGAGAKLHAGWIAISLVRFAIGAGTAVIASIVAYIVQVRWGSEYRGGNLEIFDGRTIKISWAGLLLAVISIFFFFYGVWAAATAMGF